VRNHPETLRNTVDFTGSRLGFEKLQFP
jgi:hypothetical protein